MPWNVVTNFLPVNFVANKQDQAGARLLAWTILIFLKRIRQDNIIEFNIINIGLKEYIG